MHKPSWAVWIVVVSLTAIGCRDRPPHAAPSDGSPATPSELTASQILARLLETYRGAKSYSDDGVVRLRYVQDGHPIEEEFPSSVCWQRPNRLALDVFQAQVRCDGKDFKARIEDPATQNIDGQIVVRPAPQELRLVDLARDALLYDILTGQLRRQPIQLELLLESSGLAAAFGKDIACQRLEDADWEGRPCHRVEVPSPGGAFIFWIDEESFLLRRLEYPAEALLPQLSRDESIRELSLSAELRSAAIDAPIEPQAFAMEIPAGSRQMKSFVMPPRPLPSDLFGRKPEPFSLTALDGGQISRDDLAGRIALLVWYRDHPACQATMQELEKVRREFAGDPDVVLYAVSTDPSSAGNDDLLHVARQWEVELPILRDLEAFGDSVFHIEGQPTIVVLDDQGRVQIYQTGGSPDLAAQLSAILKRLKQGEDVAAEILARAKGEQEQYVQLVKTGGPEPGELFEVPEAVIRQRSEPKKLTLKQAWSNRELKSPGNILVIEAEPGRLLVCDDFSAVAELDDQGKLVARRELSIPKTQAVTYLRTAVDAKGKRWYVGAAPLSPQLFLFDENWQLALTYPPEPTTQQICDVQFADLGGGDGLALYVGMIGGAGVQALSLEGKLLWSNKTFPHVISIAVAPERDLDKPRLLLTGDDGTILSVNRFGHEEPPVKVGKWPIARLAAARFPGATQAAFLGIGGDERGQPLAVAAGWDLREQWNYPLPPGVHQNAIEAVASGRIAVSRAGAWLLAAPDGSIHFLSEDGELVDHWNYGAALTGIAAAKLADRPLVIVATAEEVTACEVR